MVSQKPREIAARILLRHASSRSFLEDLLDRDLAKARLNPADRALVQELCYGCARWQATLDWLVERQTHRRPPEIEAQVLLRLGLYQLFWLDRVPAHAAVHETVEAARALELGAVAGFVNAVLRAYSRVPDETRATLAELQSRDPALGWSHPRWLVARWQSRMEPGVLQTFLGWNNSPAPTYARINTLKIDATRLIETWRTEGVDYDFGRWDWIEENSVFLMRRHPPLARLRSFEDGWFYVQDPSTLLAVRLLSPQPGERILDLCAAPGGKTTLIAQHLDNDGEIVAVEPDPKRRERLTQNCERLGADVTVIPPEDPRSEGPFDAVLVDAPCSNTGVLRRRLDARWRLTLAELERCCVRQADLIARAARSVRPGGRLVYSTCSVEPEENEGTIERALRTHSDLRLETSRTLHPAHDRVDGAFVAVFRR